MRLAALPTGFRVLTLFVIAASVAFPARAQVPLFADEFERADVISVERDGRDLFGFDAVSGQRSEFRLDIGEEVYFLETRGRIGLVLTNRRALAISPRTGFREFRYQPSETPPEFGLVEDQIALLATSNRILGFLGNGGVWVEEGMTPSESARVIRAGTAVGVVVTNRRALGLGANLRGFVSEDLRVREAIESVTAQDTLASLRTDKRILVFGALRGTWSIQDRSIR